jgi:hypothetical protein
MSSAAPVNFITHHRIEDGEQFAGGRLRRGALSVRRWGICLLVLIVACMEQNVPDQGLYGSNSYLSHAIDEAVKVELGDDVEQGHCIQPNPGFTARECVLVRYNRQIPFCTRSAFEEGRCYAIEVRASLLADPRVRAVIDRASEEFCGYSGAPIRRGDASQIESAYVIGCAGPPTPNLRLFHRTAPLTICVSGLGEGPAEATIVRFVVRGGQRVIRDAWCDTLFDSEL